MKRESRDEENRGSSSAKRKRGKILWQHKLNLKSGEICVQPGGHLLVLHGLAAHEVLVAVQITEKSQTSNRKITEKSLEDQ